MPLFIFLVMACQQERPATGDAAAGTSGTSGTTATASSDTTATTGSAAQALPMPKECPPPGTCPGSTCQTAITQASTAFPAQACPRFGEFQSDVDVFSWNEFIALNWPANLGNCSPNTSRSILNVKSNDGTATVWQTYMPSDRVFVAAGKQPAAWCSGNGLAGGMRAIDDVAKAEPIFAKLGAHFARIAEPDESLQAAGGVLTDQSGRWVRYEKLMNYDEYTYVVQNKLWSKAGLTAFKNSGKTTLNLPTGPTGAVEIKASWKVLTPQELSSGKYFTTRATVYNTPSGAPSPGKNPVTLGLVGLHIIHKTPQQTGFFWSTFEHVDNDRVFFNPASNTAPNTQTAQKPYAELNPNGSPKNLPVQVKRTHPTALSDTLNAYYRSLLAGSVFANYRLISTQWQTGGAPQGTPPFVANITMETFVQDLTTGPKKDTTGCLACHIKTPTSVAGLAGDSSFFFLNAQ